MFEAKAVRTRAGGALNLLELIYHGIVRNVRKSHGHAVIGLIMNIKQAFLLVAVFWVMFNVMPGMRSTAIRGDFMLYLMSGIFMFMTHNRAVSAVFGSEGPTSAMMKHAPMNTVIAISTAALGALYLQTLAMVAVMFVYYAFWPFTIHMAIQAFGMYLLAWFSGVAVGMVFLAAKPWAPGAVAMIQSIYQRANMIASGKMFVANSLPGFVLPFFDWNPLFHCIDQARGFIFLNYNPHFSSIAYPLYLSFALIMVGLMGEFVTRRSASVSWGAGK